MQKALLFIPMFFLLIFSTSTSAGSLEDAIEQAVDAPGLTWTTGGILFGGGSSTWGTQTGVSQYGTTAASSLPDGIGWPYKWGSTWLETQVEGPGVISFYWKILDQDNASIQFIIDNNSTNPHSSIEWKYGLVFCRQKIQRYRDTYFKMVL